MVSNLSNIKSNFVGFRASGNDFKKAGKNCPAPSVIDVLFMNERKFRKINRDTSQFYLKVWIDKFLTLTSFWACLEDLQTDFEVNNTLSRDIWNSPVYKACLMIS